jgi:hypothetical protein
MNDQNIPISNISDPRILELDGSTIAAATLALVKGVNYLTLANPFSSGGGPVTSFATSRYHGQLLKI